MLPFLSILVVALLSIVPQSSYGETAADAERQYVLGDVKLSFGAVTGDYAASLAALAAGGRPNMMLTKEIGEHRIKIGKAGRDFLVAPVSHVAMSGLTPEHLEVANLLLRIGANPSETSLSRVDGEEDFGPAIMYALGYHVRVNASRAAMLQRLLLTYPEKFDMSAVNAWANATRRSPAMHCAIEANFYDGVYVLLSLTKQSDRFVYDINERNRLNQTGLIVAAMWGNSEIAKLMVHNDVKILYYDALKRTALHMAATYGRTSVIDAILAARRDLEVMRHLCERKDAFGRTALDLASLVPTRRGTVRMLRSKLTAVGVVPHTAPWLVPPLREYGHGEAHRGQRNLSDVILKAMERSREPSSTLAWRLSDPSFIAMADYASGAAVWAVGDIDAVYRATPWTDDLAKTWFARHYVSANRPVLLLPDILVLDKIEKFLRFLVDASHEESGLVDAFVFTSSTSYHRAAISPSENLFNESIECGQRDTSDIHARLHDLHGEFFVSDDRVITRPRFNVAKDLMNSTKDADGGMNAVQLMHSHGPDEGFRTELCAHSPSDDLFELSGPEDESMTAKLLSFFHTNRRIASELALHWCAAAHQSANSSSIAIGDFGSAAYGSVELQAYIHVSLVAGARHWYIFPPVDNSTAVSWQWEVISNATDALSTPPRPNIAAMLNYMSEQKLENVHGVEFYEMDQFPGDTMFIPGGWSYFYVNILDAVSVIFGNCMLDETVPNCIRQTIDTNNEFAYMGR